MNQAVSCALSLTLVLHQNKAHSSVHQDSSNKRTLLYDTL